MCIYRDLYTYSQDYWQGNAENYLWLAELLLSAKGSSHMLRWGCKLSWKWVSFAVSFPFSFVLYLTESACCFTLQTSTNEVVKLWWPSIYMTSFGQSCVSVLGEGRFSALNYKQTEVKQCIARQKDCSVRLITISPDKRLEGKSSILEWEGGKKEIEKEKKASSKGRRSSARHRALLSAWEKPLLTEESKTRKSAVVWSRYPHLLC